MNRYRFSVNRTAQTRRIKHDDVEYLVVPVVALRAGLLNGEQVPADEVDAYPESWNGRPVVLGHPRQGDTPVSANDPDILARVGIGHLYNASAENGKLKAEMWLDVARAKRMGGDALEALNRFERGEPTEVSTAYWRDKDGDTARNLRPDHLAVLLHEEGACSWKDGCGAPRLNQQDDPGVAIVLPVPSDLAREMAVEGGLPANELHLTLAYLGKVSGFNYPHYKESLLEWLEGWAAKQPPVSGNINGVGRFDNQEEEQAYFAILDSPTLPEFRQALVESLNDKTDILHCRDHGFVPHITLAYLRASQGNPRDSLRLEGADFRSVSLWWGDERYDFELSGDKRKGVQEMKANVMSKARRPTFSGASAGEWTAPTLADYLNAYPGDKPESAQVEDLPAAVKRWIAAHTLLGDPEADNFRDLSFFPVVGTDGKLYASALRAVLGGRGSQAQIPDASKTSAQEMARGLLDREFKREQNAVRNALQSLAAFLGFGLKPNQEGESHTQAVERVSGAWEAEFVKDDERPYRYVEDVLEGAAIVSGDPRGTLSYPYSLQDDGSVKFGAPVVVKKVYQEVSDMNELIQQILADGRLGLNEEELSGLSEAVLAKLAASLKAQQEPGEEDDEEEMEEMRKQNQDPAKARPAANAAPLSPAFELPPALVKLSEAVEKRGGVEAVLGLLDGLANNSAARRTELIAGLSANSACAFSKAQLEALPVEHLEALQTSLVPPDYSGQGGGPVIAVNEIERLEMPDLFGVPSPNGGK